MKTRLMAATVLGVAFLLAGSSTATAGEFLVTTAQELQAALSECAQNGADDTTILEAGTYTGGAFVFNSQEDYSLTLKAKDGLDASQVIIDGDGKSSCLKITGDNYKTKIINISRITFQKSAASGYGVYIEDFSDIVISNSVFLDNPDYAIKIIYSNNINIVGNYIVNNGFGIFVEHNYVSCLIENNVAVLNR